MPNIFSKSFEYFTKNIFSIFLISILASIFSEVNIFYKFTLNNTARLLSLTILGNGIIGTFVANYAKIEIYNSIKENRNPSIINAIKNFFDYGFDMFKLQLLILIKTIMWTLLLIIPGIIKSLEYQRAIYLKVENSDMQIRECFETAKEQMQDRKLSLFGYELLASLPFVITTFISTLFTEFPFSINYYSIISLIMVLALIITSLLTLCLSSIIEPMFNVELKELIKD